MRTLEIEELIMVLYEEPRKQIFIAHSSRDAHIIRLIEGYFKDIGILPFFANKWITGRNPAEKIVNEMKKSRALFVVMTKNVTNHRETRDWVLFEIGIANGITKPIFAWKAIDAEVPDPVRMITDYISFDESDEKDVKGIVGSMMNIALDLYSS